MPPDDDGLVVDVLARLLDELEIRGRIRDEMLADPARAFPLVLKAKRSPTIRNRAAFATSLWRSRPSAPAPPPWQEPEELPPPSPPTLSALELAWSLEPATTSSLAVLAVVIGKAGGFASIAESFWWVERFDGDGELIERARAMVEL